ncbi:hypothetical protein M8C21_011511 [Ambrosia artemisiifolia]|uniref:Cathepsin propeptide inhibitor domain-containing protein n=1 Tax=Ambrosia artemisiifolia TaxID=4212 RepID=A0AAD5BXW1_AMBAR|nr:hypothetical protein M8C21_011511 [Ambrosia artemisiifolia]
MEGQFGAMAAASVKSDKERFAEWMKKYNRTYETKTEWEIRFSAFKENLHRVEAHFADTELKGHWMGLGYFSDMTIRQFITEHLGCTGTGGGIVDESDSDDGEAEPEEDSEEEAEGKAEAEGDVTVKRQRIGCKDKKGVKQLQAIVAILKCFKDLKIKFLRRF